MNILLISGHGGTPYDPGACGCGYKEAVETRRITTALAPMLRKYGFDVSMYDQNNDAYKILKNGGSLPLSGIGYVIEVHLNAGVSDTSGNGSTTGTEVLVHTGEKGTTVEQAICKRISALGFKNRGVKRRGDLLVMNTVHRKGISHALIEVCFIDDADDMKLYKEKFYDIARAIAAGVAEGFGKEVDDMTAQEVKKIIYEELAAYEPVYTTIANVPEWGKATVDKLMKKGYLKGDGGGLNISDTMLRVLVINDRAGIYGD